MERSDSLRRASRFEVHVVPGSRRPGPDGRHGGLPRLRVSARASEGRANREAERLLSDALATPVDLVSGERSRRKLFETELEQSDLDERLRRIFGA